MSGQAPPIDEPGRAHLRALRLFLLTLLVLFVVAQSHRHRVWVMAVFALYIVGATLWVRVQYVDSVRGRAYVPPSRRLWLAVGSGVVAAGGGVVLGLTKADTLVSASWFVVGGFLTIYLAAGYLVASSRQDIARAMRKGASVRRAVLRLVGTLLLLLGVAWTGMWLLGRTRTWFAAGVIVLGLLFVPWVLAKLSEHAIQAWSTSLEGTSEGKDRVKDWIWLLPGALLVVVPLVVGLASNWVFGLVVLAFGGLIVAIASFTLADIAVVLALISLAGLTPAQDSADRPLSPPPADGSRLLVALGDSYMSGEGASVFIEGTDEGAGNECRRASTAWPMLSGRQVDLTRAVSFACSGADSFNVRHTAEHVADGSEEAKRIAAMEPTSRPQFEGFETQLDEYDDWVAGLGDAAEDFAPALVVLSIGGNDAGFASVGMTCLAPGSCNDDEPSRLWVGGNLQRVQNRIRQVYADVNETFPSSPVVVIPYPDPIGDDAPCDEAALSEGDVTFLDGFLPGLNFRIATAAREVGFHYAEDVESALEARQLQLCDAATRDRPGLNFIGLRSVGGLSEQRFNPAKWTHNSLHPNERGHSAVHEAFQRWLSAQGGVDGLADRLRIRGAGPGPETETSTEVVGECDTFGFDAAEGCKAQSIAWALRQTGQYAALRVTPVLLGVGLVAWLFAVTFFGWRRKEAK